MTDKTDSHILTDEQIKQALVSVDPETKRLPPGFRDFARAIEALAVSAERERCIQACVSGGELAEQIYGTGCECVMTAELCADKIREGE